MQFKRLVSMVLLTGFLAAPAIALSGCNTIEGAGRDVERAGEWTQDKSEELSE